MMVKVFVFAFFAACLLTACSKDNGKQPVLFSAEEITAVNGQDMPDSLSAEKTDGGNTAPVPLPPQNADIEIEPAVRSELEDFLADFVSPFSLGDLDDKTALVRWGWDDGNRIEDAEGKPIEEAVFVRQDYMAFDFFLYDLNSDRIPEVFITLGQPNSGPPYFVEFYQCLDGAYRLTPIVWDGYSLSHGYDFFLDEKGKLIMFVNDYMNIGGYWHAALHPWGLAVDNPPLADADSMGVDAWFDYQYHGITIPGRPDSGLSRIPRLARLEDEVTACLRQRLMQEG